MTRGRLPDVPAAADDDFRRVARSTEELFERLELDAQARREFEEERERHLAGVQEIPPGDAGALREQYADYIQRLAEIATRYARRHRRQRDSG